MARPFLQSRLKIARARHHASDVSASISEYIASQPISIKEWVEDQYLHHEISILADPADMLSPMIGDAIHALRSSLDLLACELVRMNRQNDKGVYFPFASSEDELEKAIKSKNMDRAAPEVVELLRSLKPFTGGNIALRTVHDLDIEDKHRGIIPAVGYVEATRIGIGAAFVGETPRILSTGMALILNPSEARNGTRSLPVRMVFHPGSGFADREIAQTLHSLVEEFTRIVDAFELCCFGTLSE